MPVNFEVVEAALWVEEQALRNEFDASPVRHDAAIMRLLLVGFRAMAAELNDD